MGRSYTGERTFSQPKSAVFEAAQRALPTVKKMRIKAADPGAGRIAASKGITFKSWGENVSVLVEEDGPDRCRVTVESRVKAQLMDWGANKQNVESVLNAIALQLGG